MTEMRVRYALLIAASTLSPIASRKPSVVSQLCLSPTSEREVLGHLAGFDGVDR